MLVTFILEVLVWILGRGINYHEVSHRFPQLLQENAWMVP
jgi:hypothetical protein